MQYLYERIKTEEGTEIYAGQTLIQKTISPELAAEWERRARRCNAYFLFVLIGWGVLLAAWLISAAVLSESLLTSLLGAITMLFWFPVMLFWVRRLVLPERKERELIERCHADMQIPPDAVKLEIVYPTGLEKHGWINGNHKGYLCTSAFFRVYLEDGFLHLASATDVMAIPWASLSSIEPEEKGRLNHWIQQKPLQQFKQYHVKKHAADHYSIRFHRIIIHDRAGEFYFCLPNYEIAGFCEMTRMYINEA